MDILLWNAFVTECVATILLMKCNFVKTYKFVAINSVCLTLAIVVTPTLIISGDA